MPDSVSSQNRDAGAMHALPIGALHHHQGHDAPHTCLSDISGRQHNAHTGHGARGVSVYQCDFCVGAWTANETGMQLSRKENVTGKATLALDQIGKFVVVARLGVGKFEFLSRHGYFKDYLSDDR
jgi:hypothetical protein